MKKYLEKKNHNFHNNRNQSKNLLDYHYFKLPYIDKSLGSSTLNFQKLVNNSL